MNMIRKAFAAALFSLGSMPTTVAAQALAPDIFASCNAALVRQAADKLLDDPETLQRPIWLFLAAQGLRVHGDRENGAFFYLLGRLRATRQAIVDLGEAEQAVAAMSMTVGPLIMPDLGVDADFASAAIARTLDWDKARPDPFRERALFQGGKAAADIAALEASYKHLPDEIRTKVSPEAAAAVQKDAARQIAERKAAQCRPDTVDASEYAAAVARISDDALRVVATHPRVLGRAEGIVRGISVAAMERSQNLLPHRLTITVASATHGLFLAEVDVNTTVSERRLTSIKTSLVCLTGQGLGNRTAGKDVCSSDANAETVD